MQDHTVYCQTSTSMENTGAKLWHGLADRTGEGAMVGPLTCLSGAWNSEVLSCKARDQLRDSNLTSPPLSLSTGKPCEESGIEGVVRDSWADGRNIKGGFKSFLGFQNGSCLIHLKDFLVIGHAYSLLWYVAPLAINICLNEWMNDEGKKLHEKSDLGKEGNLLFDYIAILRVN